MCDDGDPCTREACSSGMCSWTPDPTCGADGGLGDGGMVAPSGGCGCRVTSASGAPAAVLALLGLALLGLARRRRQRGAPPC
ncbi:MAG: MYXO-CTERM sorting domain-containing protein [Sandaracinaceae bacterium]|nr:MYXO-CTERM sorting domain-containing protein [Sandaracinaceae bacterium]